MIVEIIIIVLVFILIMLLTLYLMERERSDGLKGYQDQSLMVDKALEEETAKKILQRIMWEMEKDGK